MRRCASTIETVTLVTKLDLARGTRRDDDDFSLSSIGATKIPPMDMCLKRIVSCNAKL